MILITVIGNLGYSVVVNIQDSNNLAAKKVTAAISKLESDFRQIQNINEDTALHLAHDPNFLSAYASQDRTALSNIIRSTVDQRNFAGFITVIDEHGRVFFSSDTPAKFGFNARERSAAVDHVFSQLGQICRSGFFHAHFCNYNERHDSFVYRQWQCVCYCDC